VENLLQSLGIDPKAIIAQILAFLIVFWVLKRFAFGKVGMLIENRRREMEQRDRRLSKGQAEIERLEIELGNRLREIESEAQSRLREAVDSANEEREKILSQSRQDAARELETARTEIKREKEVAIQELRSQMVELSIEAAGKVLDENLDNARNRKLVDEFIDSIPDRGQN